MESKETYPAARTYVKLINRKMLAMWMAYDADPYKEFSGGAFSHACEEIEEGTLKYVALRYGLLPYEVMRAMREMEDIAYDKCNERSCMEPDEYIGEFTGYATR